LTRKRSELQILERPPTKALVTGLLLEPLDRIEGSSGPEVGEGSGAFPGDGESVTTEGYGLDTMSAKARDRVGGAASRESVDFDLIAATLSNRRGFSPIS
jgi:hypothetical protein